MTKMAQRVIMAALLATAVSLAAPPAFAQRNGNYPVEEMNFDLWCQEQAGLPADRCDKRTAQDEAAFEAYRAKVEAYEIPYLQQKENAAQLNREILHADPIDNPVDKNPSAAAQQAVSPANPPKP